MCICYCSHDTELADLSQYFDTATTFIHEQRELGNGVLVHCQQVTTH